jgi:hypothetical protein
MPGVRNNSTDDAMIGDAAAMYNYIEQTKKIVDSLIVSRDNSLKGIDDMGDGFKDNVYVQFHNDFEEFSKYIDNLNEYNHRAMKYYAQLAEITGIWDSDKGAEVSRQTINVR